MAKLYFYYASMNAGKSTRLLQADFNYRERGLRTALWTAAVDDRALQSSGKAIESRIGLAADADRFDAATDFWAQVGDVHAIAPIACLLIDEAQFLTPAQVWQCARLVDQADVPVLCHGLRTDFRGELFAGSAALLGLADALIELKAVCHCGRKATMNLRRDADGETVSEGAQTQIGGNDHYISVCRRHFADAMGVWA